MKSLMGSSSEGALGRTLARAASLRALDRLLRACLDPPLSDHCRAAGVRSGRLLLQADSPAWGARLRYAGPRLLACLRQRSDYDLAEVTIRVEPANEPTPVQRPPLRLSADSAELLRATAETIPDAELRAALQRLARHGQAR